MVSMDALTSSKPAGYGRAKIRARETKPKSTDSLSPTTAASIWGAVMAHYVHGLSLRRFEQSFAASEFLSQHPV